MNLLIDARIRTVSFGRGGTIAGNGRVGAGVSKVGGSLSAFWGTYDGWCAVGDNAAPYAELLEV